MYYNSHKLTGKQVPPLPPTFNQTLSSGLFLALLQWSSPPSHTSATLGQPHLISRANHLETSQQLPAETFLLFLTKKKKTQFPAAPEM